MLAYYASRISGNIAETPEGFLICRNVPIARTGFQEYLPEEIGREGSAPVRVYRSAQEVFSPAALSSFEGKPVTFGHPPCGVSPENAAAYLCGHVQNVRPGQGEDARFIMADLFLTDPGLIARVREGLREVSCGYDCEYADGPRGVEQRAIRGNHVAVVEKGRAGSRVAIRDGQNAVPAEGRGKTMTTRKKRLFAAPGRETEPEETMLTQETAAQLLAAVEKLTALAESLTGGAQMDEEELEAQVIAPEEAQQPVTSPLKEAIAQLKPIIAALPEDKRAEAVECAARALRKSLGMQDGAPGVYAAISRARSAQTVADCSAEELGRRIMAARNPHYRQHA